MFGSVAEWGILLLLIFGDLYYEGSCLIVHWCHAESLRFDLSFNLSLFSPHWSLQCECMLIKWSLHVCDC